MVSAYIRHCALFTVVFLVFSSAVLGAPGDAIQADNQWEGVLKKRLRRAIKKSKLRESTLGVFISVNAPGKPRVIYNLNAQKPRIPASLTKIVTAVVALNEFPPNHKFHTRLVSTGKIHGDVLKGDLILKGGGDPGFVSETMWFLVNEFVRTGIHRIEGDIIVDDSYFDTIRFDSSRDPARVDRAYDAPIGAMSFNWNSLNIFLRPSKKVGDPIRVFTDPKNEYFHVINRSKTVKGRRKRLEVKLLEATACWGGIVRKKSYSKVSVTQTYGVPIISNLSCVKGA